MPSLILSLVSTAAVASAGILPNVIPSGSTALPEHNISLGFLEVPVTRQSIATGNNIRRRQINEFVGNPAIGSIYMATLSVGTPPQSVQVLAASTTKANTGKAMNLAYGIGQCAGEYYTNSVIIGSSKIVAQQFGVAISSSEIYAGILGVGLGKGLGTNYYNIVDQLALQGVTVGRAFSTYLGNVATTGGQFYFPVSSISSPRPTTSSISSSSVSSPKSTSSPTSTISSSSSLSSTKTTSTGATVTVTVTAHGTCTAVGQII
ncbi:hypothetical protein G7Y89_g11371 [Cudoniella acicularis]|uniref:Peptidase A1 domain-containing protein n=1 Tax=Cudoniella acicularis TaxID=354080 RepID=A0A8H4RDD0_9HELO|nr:hypothetical protein G7Y89_g11371 [Cudoniella acicularis]